MKKLTCTVEEAGKALGLSRNGAYQAAARGELPTVRFGRRLVVPLRALDELMERATRSAQTDSEQPRAA